MPDDPNQPRAVAFPPPLIPHVLDYFDRINRSLSMPGPALSEVSSPALPVGPYSQQVVTGPAANAPSPSVAISPDIMNQKPISLQPIPRPNEPRLGTSSIQLPQVYESGPPGYDDGQHVGVAQSYIGADGQVKTEKNAPYYSYDPVSQRSFMVHEGVHRDYLQKTFPGDAAGGIMAGIDNWMNSPARELPAYDAQFNFLQDYLTRNDPSIPGWHAVFNTYSQIGKRREEVGSALAQQQHRKQDVENYLRNTPPWSPP